MTAGSRLPSEAARVASGSSTHELLEGQVVLIPQDAAVAAGGTSEQSGEQAFRLSTLIDALRRRRRLAVSVFSVVLAAGALLTLAKRVLDPVYAGSFLLLVGDPLIRSEGRAGEQRDLRELALESSTTTNIPNLIEVLSSPLLLQPIATKLGVDEDKLADGLAVARPISGAEGVLEVTLEWDDRLEGEKILEALSRDYLAFSLRQRQEKLAEGLSFLDTQAPALVRQVADLQEQLSNFRTRNDFLEPLKQGEAIQGQRQQLEARLGELKQREAQLLGSMAAVRAGKFAAQDTQGGGGGQNLISQVNDLEAQLAEAEASFRPDSPQVRSLRDRLNEVKPLLQRKELEAIEAALAEVRSEQAELDRQDRDLTRRFATNPGLVKQYDAIQQRLDVARENLSSYIRTREDFRLEEAQRTGPWRIISPPRFDAAPVKPDLRRNLLLTMVLGAVAGGGAALIRDQLDRRYHRSSEVARDLGLPLLGDIPFLPEGTEASPAAQEALRNLATTLELLPNGRGRRLILIASADAAEGRSRLAALLGRTLADQGQRVLLVDADLQNPTLPAKLGVEAGPGCADLLLDAAKAPDTLIQPLGNRLDLLSAGTLPGQASRLLGSQDGRRMIEKIRNLPDYDLVLFDTPPTMAVGDALLLGREVDGIVFVVALERVNRALPAQALDRFRGIGAEVLGVVANTPSASPADAQPRGWSF
jgi:capsular exopolysaccharide synthesis family protein